MAKDVRAYPHEGSLCREGSCRGTLAWTEIPESGGYILKCDQCMTPYGPPSSVLYFCPTCGIHIGLDRVYVYQDPPRTFRHWACRAAVEGSEQYGSSGAESSVHNSLQEGDSCRTPGCPGKFEWREIAGHDEIQELVCPECKWSVHRRETTESLLAGDGFRDDEEGKVLDWRIHSLLEAGYSTKTAQTLALNNLVNLSLARELRQKGCSEELALRILL